MPGFVQQAERLARLMRRHLRARRAAAATPPLIVDPISAQLAEACGRIGAHGVLAWLITIAEARGLPLTALDLGCCLETAEDEEACRELLRDEP
jgi:hypothetical protein